MKQFIGKLRAWKKAYDVFPSMAADREFQEILDSALSQERLGEVVLEGTDYVHVCNCFNGQYEFKGKRGVLIFREQEGK